jgi:hypothetical protein
METNLEKLADDWVKAMSEKVDGKSEYYCQTRDIFQTRLDKMLREFLRNGKIDKENIYLASAIAGEIGNNSFDHNLGSWPNIPGIFFGYQIKNDGNNIEIVLADRGQGVFETLKKVKPEIVNDQEALKTAFTERISGRSPEKRGNGLKFVKENVEDKKMHLVFFSGDAKIELNSEMQLMLAGKEIHGCLAVLNL